MFPLTFNISKHKVSLVVIKHIYCVMYVYLYLFCIFLNIRFTNCDINFIYVCTCNNLICLFMLCVLFSAQPFIEFIFTLILCEFYFIYIIYVLIINHYVKQFHLCYSADKEITRQAAEVDYDNLSLVSAKDYYHFRRARYSLHSDVEFRNPVYLYKERMMAFDTWQIYKHKLTRTIICVNNNTINSQCIRATSVYVLFKVNAVVHFPSWNTAIQIEDRELSVDAWL